MLKYNEHSEGERPKQEVGKDAQDLSGLNLSIENIVFENCSIEIPKCLNFYFTEYKKPVFIKYEMEINIFTTAFVA